MAGFLIKVATNTGERFHYRAHLPRFKVHMPGAPLN